MTRIGDAAEAAASVSLHFEAIGATAARATIERGFRISQQRGQLFCRDDSRWLLATYHPSAVLRAPEKVDRDRMRGELVADLRKAVRRSRRTARRQPASQSTDYDQFQNPTL